MTRSQTITKSVRSFVNRARTKAPLWPALLGLFFGILVGDHLGLTWWLLLSIGGLVTALLVRKRSLSLLILGFMVGHGSHGLSIAQQRQWLAEHAPPTSPEVELRATVLDTGSRDTGPYLIRVNSCRSCSLPHGNRLVLRTTHPEQPPLRYGDIVHLTGYLNSIATLRNPHGFDQRAWRHRQGADLEFTSYQAVRPEGVNPVRWPVRQLTKWKKQLSHRMTVGLGPETEEAQLIRAVVLGERPPRPSTMIDDFRNSGTLHVFAVSGLHVGMVGSIIALLFWFLRCPRWLTIVLTIAGMILYAGITGLRPPAVRAVIMATVFLSGFLIQRRPTLINSLAVSAVIVLLWDGHQLFTAGFQLSYGVLFAIALLSHFWTRVYQPIAALDPFMPRLMLTPWQERWLTSREKIQGALAVSTSAWFGSTPLTWLHFGIVTPISIIASLPLMFLIFCVLSLAILSIVLGAVWPRAGVEVNQINAWIARGTHHCAATFANLPGSHFSRHPERPENGRIIIFDLPDGAGSHLLQLGGDVLLDSGKSAHFRYHVQPTLGYLQAQPDSLIISHADANHCAAMNRVLALYQPKQAIIPSLGHRSPSYRRFLDTAPASGCKLIIPGYGQTFSLDAKRQDTFLEILHAPAELEGDGKADDSGLVIRLHWRGWRILFTGDAGWVTESRLLEAGIDLQSDLIVMGRHGDDFTGRLEFIEAVSPKAIISSHWHYPEHERIPDKWKKDIQRRGITLLDQKNTGAVTITLINDQLQLTPTLPTARPLSLQK